MTLWLWLWIAQQQSTPATGRPFWPEDAQGWAWLATKVFGFIGIVVTAAWKVYVTRQQDLKQIAAAHDTEVRAREALGQMVRDERQAREAAYLEARRDLAAEAVARQNRDEAQERAMFELREAMQVTTGNLHILTTQVGEDRIDIQRGFRDIEKQMAAGFANLLAQIFEDRRQRGDTK